MDCPIWLIFGVGQFFGSSQLSAKFHKCRCTVKYSSHANFPVIVGFYHIGPKEVLLWTVRYG